MVRALRAQAEKMHQQAGGLRIAGEAICLVRSLCPSVGEKRVPVFRRPKSGLSRRGGVFESDLLEGFKPNISLRQHSQ